MGGGGGLGLGGPEEKGPNGVSKGPKPPIQLLQLLKNSPREANSFRYILLPLGPTQEMELIGPGGEGPSRSPPVSPAMSSGPNWRPLPRSGTGRRSGSALGWLPTPVHGTRGDGWTW